MTAGTLAAIAAAEAEAREWLETYAVAGYQTTRWASDRLRLCARDRAVLERHAPLHRQRADLTPPEVVPTCAHCRTPWPCPDAQAVTDYWQGETP